MDTKDRYYAVVDKYEDVVGDDGSVRQRIAKPIFRDGLCVFRRPPAVSGNVVIEQEKCEVLHPNANGIYAIFGYDSVAEEKSKAMDRYMKRHPNIIGPFNSMKDAIMAQNNSRPKTAAEKLADENAELRAEVEKTKKG